jgi:spore maturation protein CgeB
VSTIVIFGLSITSAWGNGHATTWRGLVRELGALGHTVHFFERDVSWYAENRDMPRPEGCTLHLYASVAQVKDRAASLVREADAVIVGSYVPEGVEVAEWILATAKGPVAFYDIDTPVTLAKLDRGDEEYLSRALVPQFEVYLSFTGGPTLGRLERLFGARKARALYCSVDPRRYGPVDVPRTWELGYLGTYSPDRQYTLDRLLLEVARHKPASRFVVGGPSYPADIAWPANVDRHTHVSPGDHPAFYCGQRYTLNVTRADMVRAGWSPSVRLFEAAACGVPIISDPWPGLEDVLSPGREVLVATSSIDVCAFLEDLPESVRLAIAGRARDRVLEGHTAAHRARELLEHLSVDVEAGDA